MAVPKDLLYSKQHTWFKKEQSMGRIGITYYAQAQLGEITFIDLPKVGAIITQYEKCATIESVKTVADMYSPVSGKIFKINELLLKDPELINQSCYDKGWLMILETTSDSELDNLMQPEVYDTFLDSISK